MKSAEEIANEFRKRLLGLPSHPNLLEAYNIFESELARMIRQAREEVREECAKMVENLALKKTSYPPSLTERRVNQPSIYSIELARAIRELHLK